MEQAWSEEAPRLFRCPISMELMENPVTVSTGVTYERRNIEEWLYTYTKTTCPATMQHLHTFDLTPNHTLKRLIQSWHDHLTVPSSPVSSADHDNLLSLLATVQSTSTPFKVTSLKKLQSIVTSSLPIQKDLVRSGGVQVLAHVMSRINVQGADFAAFRACEESVAVLHHLPLSDKVSAELLLKAECLNPMMVMLQKGSAEARLHTMTILQKMSAVSSGWMKLDVDREEIDVIKSLLELLSDEISTTTSQLSSCSLDVLIEIVSASKKNRQKAVEAGAVCVLIELLPDSNRAHKCEKILLLIKKLCECPEGRLAFTDHGLGVAAVSKKVLRVSDLATKLGVKILWLVCNFMPKEKVMDDMMAFGAVRKLFGLLHVDGRSSTKVKAVRMLKMHGSVWRRYACFPCELKEYVKFLHH